MKYFRSIALYLFFFYALLPALHGEILVSYPLERTVFQRDNNNQAIIYIAGNFSQLVERIEVQLRPVRPEWGQATDWTVIEPNPSGGYFSGTVTCTGGWYELEVRGKTGEAVIGNATVNRVGVGEVFLIAGQSNAQGMTGKGAFGANDERVIRAGYDGIDGPNAPLPYPGFEHLDEQSVISPRGKTAWAWGKVGDLLSDRLNVPVLFYNAAWEGSGMKSWRESISGQAWSVYDSSIPFVPTGMPYGNFRNVMQNYVAITGLRAVLWCQGEADSDVGTSREAYYSDLEGLIIHSRNEAGRNLSWVIARTSYTGRSGIGTAIINAQNDILSQVGNTFAGPETDMLQIPRPDGYHFHDGGLLFLADAWVEKLNDDFFQRSVPHAALGPLPVTASCAGGNQLSLAVQGDYYNYSWNNGSNHSSVVVGQGMYQVRAQDGSGNYRFSPWIRVPDNVTVTRPDITAQGPAEVCDGGSLALVASHGDYARWNTGQEGREVTIHQPGNYTVTIKNTYGCEATSPAFTVALRATELPAPPVISAAGTTTFCAGNSVTLTASTGSNSVWSNGVNNSQATIQTSGQYTARTRNAEGCFSPASNSITVQVNPLPAQPRITPESGTTFCAGGQVVLRSSYTEGNTWSNNSSSPAITVAASGAYTVRVKDANGCENTSAAVDVTVNPLPKAPVVTAQRPTTFCQNDYTLLSSDTQHSYLWNTGTTTRELRVTTAGDYSLTTTDANGCTSGPSSVTRIVVNPNPPRPVITPEGPTTFCANQDVVLAAPEATGYTWSDGSSTRRVTLSKPGSYTVRISNQFGCNSTASAPVSLQTLSVPATPVIVANGKTDFCEGESVTLTAQGNPPFEWSDQSTRITLDVAVTGTYTARTKGTNGCFSNTSNTIAVLARKKPQTPVLEKTGVYVLTASSDIPSEFHWQEETTLLPEETASSIKVTRTARYTAQAFITYTDVLTCSSDYSEPFLFFVDPNDNQFSIYPNPNFDGTLFAETLPDLSNARIVIFNALGQLAGDFSFATFSTKQELPLQYLPPGLYLVQIQSQGFRATEKLVIVK